MKLGGVQNFQWIQFFCCMKWVFWGFINLIHGIYTNFLWHEMGFEGIFLNYDLISMASVVSFFSGLFISICLVL